MGREELRAQWRKAGLVRPTIFQSAILVRQHRFFVLGEGEFDLAAYEVGKAGTFEGSIHPCLPRRLWCGTMNLLPPLLVHCHSASLRAPHSTLLKSQGFRSLSEFHIIFF